MPNDVVMPQLSETMKDGKLLRWCVQPGDYVYEGDALAEIEADKANMELEALTAGAVTELLVQPGQTIAVGEAVARIDHQVPAPGTERRQAHQGAGNTPGLAASPLAQRMAHDRGIDISKITGTGPGGAVTPQDVEQFGNGSAGQQA